MISLRKIKDVSELKMGMTILISHFYGNHTLEKINCIDNGMMWTEELHDGNETKDDLEDFLETVGEVFEVMAGHNPDPYKPEPKEEIGEGITVDAREINYSVANCTYDLQSQLKNAIDSMYSRFGIDDAACPDKFVSGLEAQFDWNK